MWTGKHRYHAFVLYSLWVNRHAIWKSGKEAVGLQRELEEIHTGGRNNSPAVETTLHGEFATSWFNQLRQLLYRGARAYWRNPTYLMAKLILNIFAGLFIGVSLYLTVQSADDDFGFVDSLLSSRRIIVNRESKTSSLFVFMLLDLFSFHFLRSPSIWQPSSRRP
jgi:hypothetical protein